MCSLLLFKPFLISKASPTVIPFHSSVKNLNRKLGLLDVFLIFDGSLNIKY